jgi:cytochrome c oxidase cbb3-type subunit 3
MRTLLLPVLTVLVLVGACEREKREFRGQPSTPPQSAASMTDLKPGAAPIPASQKNPVEENAYAVSEGKRLFRWYNCNGCHGAGGGNMGPALMDDKWIYGHEPANVFATIVQGRPNGMPAFGGRIPETQVWQLTAYVRSLSGQLAKDVAPGRSDAIQSGEPESARDKEAPKRSGEPTAATQ